MNGRRMWNNLAISLAGFWLMVWLGATPAAETALTARITPDGPRTIGDRIELKLTATFSAGWQVRFPTIGEKLGEFQVRERKLAPASREGDTQHQEWILSLVSFRTGRFEIPEIRASFIDSQGKATEKATAPIPIEIVSVIQDKTPELRDLKPQLELPEDYTWIWVGLLCVLVAAAAAMLLRRYLKKRQGPEKAALPAVPAIPPHEEARRALELLLAKNLPAKGLLREFYFELSEIIRRMIGRQYHIVTLERTTCEILVELRPVHHEPLSLENLESTLERCDLIKFAKHEPLPDEQSDLLQRTRGLIEEARLSFEAAAKAAAAVSVAGAGSASGGGSR